MDLLRKSKKFLNYILKNAKCFRSYSLLKLLVQNLFAFVKGWEGEASADNILPPCLLY